MKLESVFTIILAFTFAAMLSANPQNQIPQAPTQGFFTTKKDKVEARQVMHFNGMATAKWCGGKYDEQITFGIEVTITIPVYGGDLKASTMDWIVRDSQGALSVWSIQEFWKRYEEVK